MNIEKSFATGYTGKNLVSPNLIIAHESGNDKNKGPDALNNEVSYMKRMIASANVTHWVGGGGRIIQILPTGRVTWGAGGKANPYAFAQVELARTNDKAQFKKDYAAYIWLLRNLADQAKIPKTLDVGSKVTDKGIKTHLWVTEKLGNTNHTDPYGYLASMGISKEQFKSDITKGLGAETPAASQPELGSALGSTYTVRPNDTLWGIANTHKSTVDYIKSINGLKSDVIIPGQVLKTSGLSPKPEPVKAPVKSEPAKATGNTTVKSIQKTVGVKEDGWDGPNTRKGVVRLFQRFFGAEDDGLIGNETLGKSKTIRLNDKGWHVYALKAMLYLKGYTSVGTPNQTADAKLIQAVKNYQKDNGLVVDGLAGKGTYAKVFKV